MSKSLKKVLKKIVSKDLNEKLAVADAKLGNSIKVKCLLDYGKNWIDVMIFTNFKNVV